MHIGDVQGRHYVYYTPPAGKRLIDVAVLVHNLNAGQPVTVKWNNVYITEANGDSWYPYWAKTKSVGANSISDPYSIGISSDEVDGNASVEFVNYTYLRLVWLVVNDPTQTLAFGIGDSPIIAFKIK
jgi:hypothetical protein